MRMSNFDYQKKKNENKKETNEISVSTAES